MLAVDQGEFEARYASVLNADACDEESKALANDPEADPAPIADRTMGTYREKRPGSRRCG